jgi:predicted transcriptional regulator
MIPMPEIIHMDYSIPNLEDSQVNTIKFIMEHDKARKIVSLLLSKKKLYLNEIQEEVKGSKTSTVQMLKELEEFGVVESKREIKEFTHEGRLQFRAVRAFTLNHLRKDFITYYSRLFKSYA